MTENRVTPARTPAPPASPRSDRSGRTALVVGATGISGSALVDQLTAEGWDVLALSRRAGADRPGVRWISADLRSADDLRRALAGEQPTHVFFTAW